MADKKPRKPKPAPGRSSYTDDDKARALEALKAGGLPAAVKAVGASKSTIRAWAKAAGLDPADYAARSTIQNEEAARASVAARRLKVVEQRTELSDTLLGRLAPKAAELIARRLEEDERLDNNVREAEEALELALGALRAAGDPPKDATPEVRATFATARAEAREQIEDARLTLLAWRTGRVKVPELVGVLTRSVTDHLALEGEAEEAADRTGSISVILTAPRPDRRNRPEPVVLEAQEART